MDLDNFNDRFLTYINRFFIENYTCLNCGKVNHLQTDKICKCEHCDKLINCKKCNHDDCNLFAIDSQLCFFHNKYLIEFNVLKTIIYNAIRLSHNHNVDYDYTDESQSQTMSMSMSMTHSSKKTKSISSNIDGCIHIKPDGNQCCKPKKHGSYCGYHKKYFEKT